jgi:hypothetical protein
MALEFDSAAAAPLSQRLDITKQSMPRVSIATPRPRQ